MIQKQDNFFSTQIANQNPQQIIEVGETGELDQTVSGKTIEEQNGLKKLLSAFNNRDKSQKGVISIADAESILQQKGVNTTKVRQYHEMSLPFFPQMLTFDQFLFVFCLSENVSENIEEKYAMCKKVDSRLINFLRLLNDYRKKCQKSGNYKEAKNSKKKIEEIRARELERRNKYLRLLFQKEMNEVEEKQREKFIEYCDNWDNFMNNYELTAADLLKKMRERQASQMQQFQERTREQLASKMHFSKYLLELQLKQKNLVKLQEYEKAGVVQIEIEELKAKELKQKAVEDEQKLQFRLRTFRKQQESLVGTLLQKVQKDRNDHLKQRQGDTEKMMIRNKSTLTEVQKNIMKLQSEYTRHFIIQVCRKIKKNDIAKFMY